MRFYENLRKVAAARREAIETKSKEEKAADQSDFEPLDEQAMQAHYDRLIAMGGNYQEMQERMARQRIETDIKAATLRIEAEEKAAEEIELLWKEHNLKKAEDQLEAMRATIIEAEKLEKEAADRSKRISEDIALSMARSWTSALDRMAFEGQKFWESMKSMARSLMREVTNILLYKMAAEPIAYGIMGMFNPTGGVGLPTVGTVPAEAGATLTKYQHGGVVMETGPAFVHAGEKITPAGQSPGGTQVHIHNEGQEKLEISSAEEYLIGDRRILDVTMKAMSTDIKYQRAMASALK